MTGFNSDIRANGDRYHVQTQLTPGGVETLIYLGGQVVYARRSDQSQPDSASEQHQKVLRALEVGELGLFVGDGDQEMEVDSPVDEPAPARSLFSRLSEFVASYKRTRQDPPEFWVDTGELQRVASARSGTITARLMFPQGRPVVGATVEIERFDLLGPTTRLKPVVTDSDGALSISCELGAQRPTGLVLRAQTDGREAKAQYLI